MSAPSAICAVASIDFLPVDDRVVQCDASDAPHWGVEAKEFLDGGWLARLEAVRHIRGAIPPLGDIRAELTLVARYVFLELEEEQELLRVLLSDGRQRPHLLANAVDQVVRGTFDEFAALLGRSGGTPVRAALALGSLVAFASAELLLGQAPVDADREEVIATRVEMVMGLTNHGSAQ